MVARKHTDEEMMMEAISAIRRITAMLLLKHERVILLMAEGNHDLASSMWLRELFAALYSDEPRIEVVTRPDPYYCIEHGKTSLFLHHGHKKKLEELETVLVSKFREIYGRTKHSYAHTGHLHYNVMLERNTMQLERRRLARCRLALRRLALYQLDRRRLALRRLARRQPVLRARRRLLRRTEITK